MNNIMKNTAKFAVGTCIALGSVAVAASVVAGSSAAKVVTAEVKAAKDATKEEMEALKKEATSASVAESSPVNSEETAMFADVEEAAKETAEN